MPPSRTSQQGFPLRSAATASRRVAVKSSAFGSPHNSPITAERQEHLTPSSIAHSASLASRASTWMRCWVGNPGGWIRPLSRIAIRSCTHSKGLSVPSCASRNPAQPPSRGCTANSSERVGVGGAGTRHGSPNSLLSWTFLGTRLAPLPTRVRPAATRLTTFLFFFCSYPVSRREESILRLGAFQLSQEADDLVHCGARALFRDRKAHVGRRHLYRLVSSLLRAPRRRDSN